MAPGNPLPTVEGLAVPVGEGVTVIVGVLQVDVDGVQGIAGRPSGVEGQRRAGLGDEAHRQGVLMQVLGHGDLGLTLLPTEEVEVPGPAAIPISSRRRGRPQGADVLAEFRRERVHGAVGLGISPTVHRHGGGDPVVGLPASPEAILRIVGAVEIEVEGVRGQLVVHIEHRGSVGRHNGAGGGVAIGVRFPTLAGDGGSIRRLDGAAHGAAGRPGIVIDIGAGRARIVVLLEHVHDGVVHGAGVPLGIQGGVALDGDGGVGRLAQFLVEVPAREGVAVAGGSLGADGDGGPIGIGAAGHVAAAVGLIGQGEVLPDIEHL